MADASYVRSSFLGGEWSQFAQGRVDRPDYVTALNVCLNGLPTETGGWVRRPGFKFAQTTRNGATGKLIKFDFQQAAPYTMEFTDGHLRFFSGANLATTNDGVGVIDISAANPAVFQTASAVTWSSGDQVIFRDLSLTATMIQNRVLAITKIDTSHFSLSDPLTGATIDGSTLGWVATPTAAVNRILDIATVYTAGSWASLRSVQTELKSYLLNGAAPYVLTVTSQPAGPIFATFGLAASNFQDGPYLDQGTTLTNASILTIQGDGSYLVTTGAWPDSRRAGGLSASDVGRHVRLFNEPKSWPGVGTGAGGDVVTLYNSYLYATYWRQNTAAAVTTPGTNVVDWSPIAPAQAAIWVWGKIATVVTATRFTLTIQGTALLYSAAGTTINSWRLGAYSNEVGWPTCGCYNEGRLWLGGAISNRIDSSISNNTDAFSPTDSTGNVLASSGISYVLNSDDVNPTMWLIQDQQGIIIGTKSGEWLVQALVAGGMSPTNISAHRVTKVGCGNVEPRRTEHTIVFVQKFGRKVMEYFADVYSGKLSAPHLSWSAKHLTRGGVQEIAYQQELSPIIWARVNGALIGCSYKREVLSISHPPTAGWHRHTLGSGRSIESIAVGPSLGGNSESLSIISNDPATGIRHVEVMGDILEEGSALTDAAYLDSAVAPQSGAYNPNPAVGAPYGTYVLYGLWHLNGKTVTAWLGGLDCGDYPVTNGSITVPFGDGISAGTASGLFTANFVGSFTQLSALVGFTFTSDGQLVRPNAPQESGARNGPAFGKKRRHEQFAVQLEGTQGISFGTSFAALYPALFKSKRGVGYLVSQQFTGIYRDTIKDESSFDGMLCWRVTRPYIGNVAAIGGFVDTRDQ